MEAVTMVTQTLPAALVQPQAQVRRWAFSTTDYHRMREIGFFREDDRLELIDGEVRLMSPIGPRHAAFVNQFAAALILQVGKIAIVSIQNPIHLNDNTEPIPDLLLLKPRRDAYASALPNPADTLLIIEVSDTTLVYDQQEKLPRYAQAGIPEVWLTDADKQTIERHSEPSGTQYATKQTFKRGQSISVLALPQITISLDSIFGENDD